jgi:hypothetical protein
MKNQVVYDHRLGHNAPVAKVLSDARPSTMRLIFIPSVVTLVLTLLRLFGELQHWSTVWFNPAAGGPLAVIGITWLAPIFGVYFARKLSGAGQTPAHAGHAVGYAVLGLILVVGGGLLTINFPMGFHGRLLFGWVVMVSVLSLGNAHWRSSNLRPFSSSAFLVGLRPEEFVVYS